MNRTEKLASIAAGLVIASQAKKVRKAGVRRNPDPNSLALLAGAMFAVGLLKSALASKSICHCSSCARENFRESAELTSPAKLAHVVALSPLAEESLFRKNLTPLFGAAGSAAAFGVGHVSPALPPAANAARVAEAALAGLLVYQPAFDSHGLLGAALVHAAHNAGVVAGRRRALRRAGYRPLE